MTAESMSRPSGRDAVRQALIDAASALYAKHGPRAVSVRDIASAAGVNHGLVHRHFGSKDGLLREVMTQLADRIAADLGAAEASTDAGTDADLLTALRATARHGYWKVLARSLLDGMKPDEMQASFPVIEALTTRVVEAQRQQRMDADLDARVVALTGVAAGLGWLLFEPFLLAAAPVGMTRASLREQAWAVVQRVAQPATARTRQRSSQRRSSA